MRLREDALAYGITKLGSTARRLQGFPHTTDHGRWRQSEHGRWTAGFWVGALWLAYLATGDVGWARQATDWAHRLAPRQHDRTTHDMGFLFQPSFVRGRKITHDPAFRDVALAACAAHASRYHPVGRSLPAWDPSEDPRFAGRTIVATVMNLPILFWGAQVGGRPEWEQIGRAVAATIRTQHLRPDGSTIHVIDFDPAAGRVVEATTDRGYAPDSCWTRGQAWALSGFTQVYNWSRDQHDLDAARRLADYFLAHLPADHVPFWDFQAPDLPQAPRDSAAGAIAGGRPGVVTHVGLGTTELRDLAEDAAYAQMRDGQDVLTRIEQLPKPVLAAVNGYALGGGVAQVAGHGQLTAAAAAQLGQPEIRLANLPGWGGTQQLPRLVGPARAKELIFTGRPIDADTACRIGLVDKVVPDAALLALADELAERAPLPLALAKQTIALGLRDGMEAGLEAEARAVARCCATTEQRAAVAAFLVHRH